jgi:hypothetical protein
MIKLTAAHRAATRHGAAISVSGEHTLDNRAALERQTAAYFKGLTSKAVAQETDLEDALSAASQEMDFDQTAGDHSLNRVPPRFGQPPDRPS